MLRWPWKKAPEPQCVSDIRKLVYEAWLHSTRAGALIEATEPALLLKR